MLHVAEHLITKQIIYWCWYLNDEKSAEFYPSTPRESAFFCIKCDVTRNCCILINNSFPFISLFAGHNIPTHSFIDFKTHHYTKISFHWMGFIQKKWRWWIVMKIDKKMTCWCTRSHDIVIHWAIYDMLNHLAFYKDRFPMHQDKEKQRMSVCTL